ncbi:MAG TPA: hypothetical protein DDY87_05435 [Clostridiales bacterium]|nr:hypothetical protein [Clostridiales bacterium]
MLKALYDYGIRNHLTVPPGFIRKPIRAYICLSQSGSFLGIEVCGKEETQVCPDIGSMANSPDKCNPLAEKASIILADTGKKPDYFRKLLREGATAAAVLRTCLNALETPETFGDIQREAGLRKIKDADRISFQVDGCPVVADKSVRSWWEAYRKCFQAEGNAPRFPCLITGQPTVPLATLPVVNGLQVVGGHSRGEALFCFDKAAFQSYGLKQSANAPVSEEAFAVVKEAMNDLLAGSPAMYNREKTRNWNPAAPIYAGMKFLHWYDFSLSMEEDPIHQSFQGEDAVYDDDDDCNEEEQPPTSERQEEKRGYRERQARRKADALVKSISSGTEPPELNGEYHIMLISGNNGRAMIRRYAHGSYQTLKRNLELWTEDLSLADNKGTGKIQSRKLFARLTRLIKDQKNTGQKLSDQMKRELAGVTPAIVMAIISGTPLPDTVAARALGYIRSRLLAAGEDDKKPILPDGIACQWLKVWLIRKRRMKNEEVNIMAEYDLNFPNAAYHCGAWLAVYACLQRAAMGNVNASLVQRFYASASQTPALAFGTLSKMGMVYLEMLRKDRKFGEVSNFEMRLGEVCAFFGSDPAHQLPATLNLEGQSYFALGYRQMCTRMIAEK